VERKLRAIAKGSRVQAFQVAVHPRVLAVLVGRGGSRLTEVEAAARRRFFLVPAAGNGHVHHDHVEVLAQGKLEAMRPAAPVAEGASVELKLVEVGLHDATAGVGKLDGDYEVVVAGAAKLVGKKVKATVGAVLEGAAYATLADDGAVSSSPITFEAEAEKPTRASRAKKAAPVADLDQADEPDEIAEPDDIDEQSDIDEPGEADPEAQQDQSADGTPTKKRTRRGTRGGRGRKKAPAAGVAAESEEAPADSEEAPADGDTRSPRIHVPPADFSAPPQGAETDVADGGPEDLEAASDPAEPAESTGAAVEGTPKRKRSRRGSRGGRKRKKPAAVGNGDTAPDGVEVVEAAEAAADSAADNGEPEYVPMSEWIDDFETRARG
jgi:predicted RNA-binding protein with TRAM domain